MPRRTWDGDKRHQGKCEARIALLTPWSQGSPPSRANNTSIAQQDQPPCGHDAATYPSCCGLRTASEMAPPRIGLANTPSASRVTAGHGRIGNLRAAGWQEAANRLGAFVVRDSISVRGNRMRFAKRHIAAATVCSILVGPSGHAATVSQQSGGVLVSKGTGFFPVGSEVELAPGTQIMVQPGGLATITYANNCAVRVGSGFWTVQAVPPCATGNTIVDFTGRMNQGADPEEATEAAEQPAPPPSMPLLGVPLEVPLLGAALAGVTVAVFTSKDKAASP